MYTQVYFHPVRRIYDLHLKEFLRFWTGDGVLPTEVEPHLLLTDHEVYSAMLSAARNSAAPGHEPARRIVEREHFREVYRRNPGDLDRNPDAAGLLEVALRDRFGDQSVRRDSYVGGGGAPEFAVLMPDGRLVPSLAQSDVLRTLPPVAVDFVFVAPEIRRQAEAWLRENRDTIIAPLAGEEAEDGET